MMNNLTIISWFSCWFFFSLMLILNREGWTAVEGQGTEASPVPEYNSHSLNEYLVDVTDKRYD